MRRFTIARAMQRHDRIGFFRAWRLAGLVCDDSDLGVEGPATWALVALLGAPRWARGWARVVDEARSMRNERPPPG